MKDDRREAVFVSRLLRIGLLLAISGQILWTLLSGTSGALTDQQQRGAEIFATNCTSCHGTDGFGTDNGPSLQGVGPAAVDFMLTSGRMPLSNPGDQPDRQAPKFTPPEIDALVAYVAVLQPGGPAIPAVDPSKGDLGAGSTIFLNNCSGCHGAAAVGDSVGGGQIAPSLYPPNATQIGEAVRTGPGVMPKFDESNLSDRDVDSIARYLLWLPSNGREGGLQLGRVGAVAEGLAAGVVGIGLLVLALKLTGKKL